MVTKTLGNVSTLDLGDVCYDCPFEPSEVLSERKTLWKCRGKLSWFEDTWQGRGNKFLSKDPTQVEHARIMAVQANVKEHCRNEPLKGIDAVAAILNDEGPSPSALEAAKRQETVKPPRERLLNSEFSREIFCTDCKLLGCILTC